MNARTQPRQLVSYPRQNQGTGETKRAFQDWAAFRRQLNVFSVNLRFPETNVRLLLSSREYLAQWVEDLSDAQTHHRIRTSLMSIAEANLDLPPNFTGVVKLFPLPNLVLFPGVIQPLHIFEPRYRTLMEDAINSDQLIAIAKLKSSSSNPNKPEIHPTVCVGKIVTHAELPDGRFNLLLLGAKRAKVIREIATDRPYRMADVQLEKSNVDPMDSDNERIRAQANRLFRRLIANDPSLDDAAIQQLLNDYLPLGMLLDLLTFSSGATLKAQQEVLETFDIEARSQKVIEILQSRLASVEQTELQFPPSFSYN